MCGNKKGKVPENWSDIPKLPLRLVVRDGLLMVHSSIKIGELCRTLDSEEKTRMSDFADRGEFKLEVPLSETLQYRTLGAYKKSMAERRARQEVGEVIPTVSP